MAKEFETDDSQKKEQILNKPGPRFKDSLNVRRLVGDRYHFASAFAKLFVHQQKNRGQYQAHHADHNVSNAKKRILTAQPACVADDQAFTATKRRYRVVCGVKKRRRKEEVN